MQDLLYCGESNRAPESNLPGGRVNTELSDPAVGARFHPEERRRHRVGHAGVQARNSRVAAHQGAWSKIALDGTQLDVVNYFAFCLFIVPMQIPSTTVPGQYRLRVEGNTDRALGGTAFLNETLLHFSQRSMTIFIQTEKPLYHQSQIGQKSSFGLFIHIICFCFILLKKNTKIECIFVWSSEVSHDPHQHGTARV